MATTDDDNNDKSLDAQAKDLADRVMASLALDELKRRHPDWVFAKNEPEVQEEIQGRYLGDGVYGKVESPDGTVKIWLYNGVSMDSYITLEPAVLREINQLAASANQSLGDLAERQ